MLPGLFLVAACPPFEGLTGGGSPSRLPPILGALLALHSRAIEAGHQSRLGLQARQRRGGSRNARRRSCRGEEITVGFGFGGSGHQQAPGCQCHSPAHLSIPFPSLPASIHTPQSSPLLDRIGANFGAELAPATFLVTCVRQARRGEARREVEVWVLLQLKMGMGGSILWQGGHPEGGKRTPHKWL